MGKTVNVGKIKVGANQSFVLIAGPCVIEDKATVMKIASKLVDVTARLKVPFVFKASYDKANRTSLKSFRGPGLKKGLAVLKEVKEKFGVPILTDVHCVRDVPEVAKVADILQIPAFLSRQTDLLVKAAKTGKVVNVKKGQFMAPWDMKAAVKKIKDSGNAKVLLTDRGASFGYNNLVSDFRSLSIMGEMGPVIFDATHSVQQPGGLGTSSGGQREYVPLLARCAVAAGCAGIFMEVHINPKKALSDGPNMIAVNQLEDLLVDLIAIDAVLKRRKR